jgi:hypothetical protein
MRKEREGRVVCCQSLIDDANTRRPLKLSLPRGLLQHPPRRPAWTQLPSQTSCHHWSAPRVSLSSVNLVLILKLLLQRQLPNHPRALPCLLQPPPSRSEPHVGLMIEPYLQCSPHCRAKVNLALSEIRTTAIAPSVCVFGLP